MVDALTALQTLVRTSETLLKLTNPSLGVMLVNMHTGTLVDERRDAANLKYVHEIVRSIPLI